MLDAEEGVSVGTMSLTLKGDFTISACYRFTDPPMNQLLWGPTPLDFEGDIISHCTSISDMMFAERLV